MLIISKKKQKQKQQQEMCVGRAMPSYSCWSTGYPKRQEQGCEKKNKGRGQRAMARAMWASSLPHEDSGILRV